VTSPPGYRRLCGVVSYRRLRGVVSYRRFLGVVSYRRLCGVVSYERLLGVVSYARLRGLVSYERLRGVVSYARLRGLVSYPRLRGLTSNEFSKRQQRLRRRVCGGATPRRRHSQGNGAMPLVRPLAQTGLGQARTRGGAPFLFHSAGGA
jgi:hypothetical protein